MMITSYLMVGVLLIAAFAVQDLVGLKWPLLEQAQDNETYSQVSGLLLMLFLTHQWYLSLRRSNSGPLWAGVDRHKLVGALAPAVFYLHSTHLGYGMLLFLSAAYFINVLLGLFNEQTLGIKRMAFVNAWTLLHVTASVFLIGLMLYHVYVAFIYE